MERKKVCLIGHFGFGKELLNGQTVKTRILSDTLDGILGSSQVMKIDTHGGAKALLKLPFQTFSAMRKCDNVVILPAHRGLRVETPLLSFWRIFFKRRLHYAVIGGWLASFLDGKKSLERQLKKFTGIYVETYSMQKDLEAKGFSNVTVMPNCKDLSILSPDALVMPEKPYKLCTFSRVMKEKGIEDAVDAVKAANEALGQNVYALDIYGQIDGNQVEWFEQLQKTFPQFVRYGGLVPYDKSVEVLKDYFALLFPTYYHGEGFAGTLLDAMASGVPVIASDWKYNTELVKEGQTGLLFPAKDVEALTKILCDAASDSAKWNAMRTSCLEEAHRYQPVEVINALLERIEA